MTDKNYLAEAVAYLGANMTPQTYNGVFDAGFTIFCASNNVVHLITELYETPRSELVKGKMVDHPKYGSLTPLPMYAMKLYHDVPYSAWNRDDPNLHLFLGKPLECLLKYEHYNFLPSEIINARSVATTKPNSDRLQLTAYRSYWRPDPDIALPIKHMLLQTWLAYGGVRDTGSMILDPVDWDNIPESSDLDLDEYWSD